MRWIDIKECLPEQIHPEENEQECLVHTNYGHFITHRLHDKVTKCVEIEPNVITSKIIDRGWCWEIEIGNSIKINPIFVDHWMFIDQITNNYGQ